MDVVFVGAGPANLSGALHLANLIKTHNAEVQSGKRADAPLGEIEIGVIEKGATVGAHILSGAVMDPRALRELIPDFVEQGAPLESAQTFFMMKMIVWWACAPATRGSTKKGSANQTSNLASISVPR